MKILVVDDEVDIKTLFEQRFRKEIQKGELDFAFANSGKDALNFINLHEHEMILILSDINMPGMSGLELLAKLKEIFAVPPPVIMMITAYGDSDNYNRAIELGADDFLTKPIDFVLLKQKLKNVIYA